MAIELQEVTFKDAKKLIALAPFSVLYRIKDIGTHTVAALYTQEGKKAYAGLLQMSVESDCAVLEWIFVAEAYRENGVASLLMDKFWELKAANKASNAKVLLYEKYLENSDFPEMTAFLSENGFEDPEPVNGPFTFNAKELILDRAALKPETLGAAKKDVVSFSELTPDEISKAASGLKIADSHFLLSADRKLSFLCKQGASYKGAAIVRKYGSTYYLRKLIADDEKTEEKLAISLIYSADKVLHLSDEIYIDYSERSSYWMKKLLPDISSHDAILLTT